MRQHPHIQPPIIQSSDTISAPIVLDSPHSGTLFPNYARSHRTRLLRQDKFFFQRYADLYMNELISGTIKFGATTITAPYARSWIDLNRQPDDILPSQIERQIPTEQQQQERLSLFWQSAGDCQLWDVLSMQEINRRLRWVWHAYHDALAEQLHRLRDKHGVALLLNCHSMPSCLGDYHVVLGDDNGASCGSDLVRYIYDFFDGRGLRVGLNDPFSGGSIIRRHGLLTEGIMAIQLELRRDLYMDEGNFRKGGNFETVRGMLDRLVENLAGYMKTA